jgi:hypothetical protein
MPLPLIDKFDNFELVRNEIAAILAKETVNQQLLADAAGKDPDLWKFDVFIERSRPWESLTSSENPVFPVVNVWFDSENFAGNQSFNALLQTAEDGIFNIDIFTVAINKKSAGEGYITADRQAVLDRDRIVRLVRNILFSVPPNNTLPGEDYTFLNLKGIVGYRRIQSIKTFQPEYDKQAVTVVTARVALAVKYIETSLEGPDQDLDLIQVDTITTDGGQVIFTFDTT